MLVTLLTACAAPDDAAQWAQREDPIVNGTREPQVLPMTPGEQLAIGFLFPTGTPSAPFCTGTLIDPRHVITARHCIEGRTAANTGFGIGVDPSGPRATFSLQAIHAHPEVDAALLVLDGDARRAAPELRPLAANRADLAGVDGRALVGQPVDVAGYGETQDAGRTGRWFAQVILAEITRTYVVVDGRGRQGLCFGDSGGPVIGQDALGLPVVLGVESRGDESCVGIDHLTRLDTLASWLDGHMRAGGEPCGDIDYQGTCAGDVAVWCDDYGRVARRDCSAEAQGCGFVGDDVGYYCTEKGGQRADGIDVGGRAAEAPAQLKGGCAQGDAPGPSPLWLLALLGLPLRRRP